MFSHSASEESPGFLLRWDFTRLCLLRFPAAAAAAEMPEGLNHFRSWPYWQRCGDGNYVEKSKKAKNKPAKRKHGTLRKNAPTKYTLGYSFPKIYDIPWSTNAL